MANALRGEADLDIGGRTYTVSINMGAIARISEACDARTFSDLQRAAFELPNMPKIVKAALEASGHTVDDKAINDMDWPQYVDNLLPALFRQKKEDDESPPRGQRKKS